MAVVAEDAQLRTWPALKVRVILVEGVGTCGDAAVVVQVVVVARVAEVGGVLTGGALGHAGFGDARHIGVASGGIVEALVLEEDEGGIAGEAYSLVEAVQTVDVKFATGPTLKKC